jgi:hypothetical protein
MVHFGADGHTWYAGRKHSDKRTTLGSRDAAAEQFPQLTPPHQGSASELRDGMSLFLAFRYNLASLFGERFPITAITRAECHRLIQSGLPVARLDADTR